MFLSPFCSIFLKTNVDLIDLFLTSSMSFTSVSSCSEVFIVADVPGDDSSTDNLSSKTWFVWITESNLIFRESTSLMFGTSKTNS